MNLAWDDHFGVVWNPFLVAPLKEMPSVGCSTCPNLARLFRCTLQPDPAVVEVANAIYEGGKVDGVAGLEVVAHIIQNRCSHSAFPSEPRSVDTSKLSTTFQPFHLWLCAMEVDPVAEAVSPDSGRRQKRKSEPPHVQQPERRIQESWEYPMSKEDGSTAAPDILGRLHCSRLERLVYAEEKKDRVIFLFEQELSEAREEEQAMDVGTLSLKQNGSTQFERWIGRGCAGFMYFRYYCLIS
eukprot:s177_g23.t2